jgi:DNA-binding transcriptional ArsR family regulator
MTYEATLVALADPTRRIIYEQVRQRPCSVGELARVAAVSQPAVSQHLSVLKRARLVRAESAGTRRIYSATTEGLAELRRYIETLWDDVLTAYAAGAETDEEAS